MSPAKKVVVRMYNVGFGDSFLVRIPTSAGTRKILFDCGSLAADANPIKEVVQQIIQDVKDADGTPRVDIVVCTHRHKDHVSGFASPAWEDVEVKEVWMPWTEHPTDPEARVIREAQSNLAAALDSRLTLALAATPAAAPDRSRLEGLKELALNALSNEAAMTTLHEGFTGNPRRRFLPDKDSAELSFEPPAMPGVRVHILGPSRDPEVIRDMDPPEGGGYLRLLSSLDAEHRVPEPFRPGWWMEDLDSHLILNSGDRETIKTIGADFDAAVAVSLDKAVNGTSLMLMLQVGKAYLLFPGDAQWGTWQAALKKSEWRELLKRTRFYKVGHHGSHNATPKEFVEEVVGKDFWAMVSVRPVDKWPEIPKAELLAAMAQRTQKVARSDQDENAPAGAFKVQHDLYVDAEIPI